MHFFAAALHFWIIFDVVKARAAMQAAWAISTAKLCLGISSRLRARRELSTIKRFGWGISCRIFSRFFPKVVNTAEAVRSIVSFQPAKPHKGWPKILTVTKIVRSKNMQKPVQNMMILHRFWVIFLKTTTFSGCIFLRPPSTFGSVL